MNTSINCCPDCLGERKIWDYSNDEEPSFEYCGLCEGNNTINA